MTQSFVIVEQTATLIVLVLIFGAAIFRVRVLFPLLRAPDGGPSRDLAARMDSFAASAAAGAAAALLGLAVVQLHAQVIALFDGWSAAGAEGVRALVLQTTWGHAWLLQVICAVVIMAGPFVNRPLDAWLAVPLAVATALNGHAAGVEGLMPLSVGLDAVHVLAAGGWAGGIFYVAVATTFAHSPRELVPAVNGFSVVARTCAALLILTGVFAVFVHLDGPRDLLTTPYGARLTAKLVLVVVMVAVGAWNWRRATPRLATGDRSALRIGTTVELFIATAVLLATARLVLLSPPSQAM